MNEGNAPDSPTLADQASKLYDLVAGYHVTHLVEIARELGVWDTLTQNPGQISSELAESLGTDYAGVDLLGDHVLELNGIPGWHGLQKATGVEVAPVLVALVESVAG